jgi:hypothetical protein
MNIKFLSKLVKASLFSITTFVVIVSAPHVFAQSTTMSDVKKELSEAIAAIRNYSAERKDETLSAMEKTLEKMDRQMDQLRGNMTKQWEKMEPEARKNAEKTMRQLLRQRDKAADAMEKLRKSGEKTWNLLQDEFIKNYEKFREGMEGAVQQYDEGMTYL